MDQSEQIRIACPHCGWASSREKWLLDRDQLVRCADCSALVSADAAVEAAQRPEVRAFGHADKSAGH